MCNHVHVIRCIFHVSSHWYVIITNYTPPTCTEHGKTSYNNNPAFGIIRQGRRFNAYIPPLMIWREVSSGGVNGYHVMM